MLLRTIDGAQPVGDELTSSRPTDGALAWEREASGRAAVVDGSRVSWRGEPRIVLEGARPIAVVESCYGTKTTGTALLTCFTPRGARDTAT